MENTGFLDAAVGEAIDSLVQVEMRFASGLPRGVIHKLYDAARDWQKEPLTMLAAQALLKRVNKGDRVLIVTGAGAPPWLPHGETDGPLGAAALARALDLGIGAKPVLVSEARNMPAIIATTEAAGLAVFDNDVFASRNACATTEIFTLGDQGADDARALIDKHQPTAVVFIEKGGPNHKGVFHTITGSGRSRELMASADALADAARAKGILTIGVGDGGNEIGFGAISEAVAEIQPFGRTCACPCGGGVATVVQTDILVVAAISNWGAYGIAAAMACGLGRADVLHDTAVEARMLEYCVRLGAVDGILARPIMGVDGTNAASQEAIIVLLQNLVSNAIAAQNRPF
jgi:hypothetical protein